MKPLNSLCVATFLALTGLVSSSRADIAPDAAERVDAVINAVGGPEKLLNIVRFGERLSVGSKSVALPQSDAKVTRVSVVQAGGGWWLGKKERNKDKVRVLFQAWSLQILRDPKSKIEALPQTTVNDIPVVGLRVSESTAEPLELWFDAKSLRLVAIDYTNGRNVFSEWKQTPDGHHYTSRAIGFRFVNKAERTVKETHWYVTDILEFTPLAELPEEFRPR